MPVMQQNAKPSNDLQRGQRERLVVIAITCDHMAGCNLSELRHDEWTADIAGMEDHVASF